MTKCQMCGKDCYLGAQWAVTRKEVCYECSFRYVDACRIGVMNASISQRESRCVLCRSTENVSTSMPLRFTICRKCEGFVERICDETFERLRLKDGK